MRQLADQLVGRRTRRATLTGEEFDNGALFAGVGRKAESANKS
jgi:hypothetical protein